MSKPIAAILARVSRPTQSLESQVNDLLKEAEKQEFIVPEKFIFQEKITGVNAGRKESLERILQAIDEPKNKISAVFIWEVTRLNRDPMDFTTELRCFTKREIPVFFFDLGKWTMKKKGNIMVNDYEVINQLIGASVYGIQEWEKIARRTQRGRDNIAEQGLYVGHLADGYIAVADGKHKRIIIDEQRRSVIERIYELFVEGRSTNEIAAILNADNVPTTAHYRFLSPYFDYSQNYHKRKNSIEFDRTKTKWSGTVIASILRNTWYKGERLYKGKTYIIDNIVSPELWKKAEEIREIRAVDFRSVRKSRKHNYILSNLIYCGKCGRKLYGHYTGKNNHYYCSSVDEGKKCGTRGVCKENIEAIVCQIIATRAVYSFSSNISDATTNYFMMSDEQEKRIKAEIFSKKKIKADTEEQIEQKHKEIDNLYLMEARGDRNPATITRLLKNIEADIESLEKKKQGLLKEINALNKRLNVPSNILDDIYEIVHNINPAQNRKMLETVVNRIEVFTIDRSINIIVITYTNDRVESLIYSYPLLRNSYINIGAFYFDIEKKKLILPDDFFVTFKWYSGLFDGVGQLLSINPNQYCLAVNDRRSGKEEAIKEYLATHPKGYDPKKGLGEEISGVFYLFDYEAEIARQNGITVYENEIDIRLFIDIAKAANVTEEFDPTPFVEADEERRAIQTEREKVYRAKRRSGLPTTLPYVIRDGNYEEYLKQRKHLYNRRYKIKKNKHLSEEEKKRQLEEIELILRQLRLKVKYLSRQEAVQRHLKVQT